MGIIGICESSYAWCGTWHRDTVQVDGLGRDLTPRDTKARANTTSGAPKLTGGDADTDVSVDVDDDICGDVDD